MNSSRIEEVSASDDNWYHITSELLSHAGITINGSTPADIRIKNPDFFKRVLREGSLGLGESCMNGWWEYGRLDMFFNKVLCVGLENQLPHHFKDTLRTAGTRLFNLQSKKRAWVIGKGHYGLGSDLFSRMLSPFMQYSCAYWRNAGNLESAQQARLKVICEKLQLEPEIRVLGVGCGWGELTHYMASNYDINVVNVTISAEQQKMVQERCEGLDVTILLQGYRNLNDQFDRIISVGMFEYVGSKNYNTYFTAVDRNLKPEDIFLLHTIGPKETDLNADPWINRYIFPNSCPPFVRQIAQSGEPHFVMEDWHNFGADYNTILMTWYERLLAA